MTDKLAEVRRVLDRYIIEIVEAYDFCPWAKGARLGGEIGVEVLWGTPTPADWVAAGQRLLAQPQTRVAMIVAPELAVAPRALRAVRDQVAARIPSAGIAEFHPDAALDLANPGRLVPFLRRSPDPLLQLVPLALLDKVRSYQAVVDITDQAAMLRGLAAEPRGDIADTLADTNHERVTRDAAAITAVLDDIADDRRRSYARVGINSSR